MAERRGFEPRIRFWRIHDFQSCSFGQLGHLSAYLPPHGATANAAAMYCSAASKREQGGICEPRALFAPLRTPPARDARRPPQHGRTRGIACVRLPHLAHAERHSRRVPFARCTPSALRPCRPLPAARNFCALLVPRSFRASLSSGSSACSSRPTPPPRAARRTTRSCARP